MSLRKFYADVRAATKSDLLLINIKWFLLNHSMHLLFLYRLGQDLYRVRYIGKVLGYILEYLIRVVYSSDMSCRADIGEGVVIVHGHDIVIGADVIIGRNCKIFNGVTLGNKDIKKSSYGNQPVIGDNVVLSTGAKVLGKVNLGDNVIVGANSVVVKDVPADSVVAGVPAKIIRDNQ
ncbi:MAG: serine acetyltransferase [Gammaproteobacteria bacterium]|nr:serine acetyltransferase [Gammaproteobacteria bacterium]